MITCLDLIKTTKFRKAVEQRLKTVDLNYSFTSSFPKLYRYRTFGEYAVSDIRKQEITLTSIGTFNDIFDGALVSRYSDEYIKSRIDKETELITKISSYSEDERNHLIKTLADSKREYLKSKQIQKFDFLNYLGTFVGCFSENQNSPLMWAYYADMNKGLCIEYDFNSASDGVKNMLFPVLYSDEPLFTDDLFEDEAVKIIDNPLDIAVLSTALNKSFDWKYEEEFRLVLVLPQTPNKRMHYVPIMPQVNPSSVTFGLHFMKNFYYDDIKGKVDREKALANIKQMDLLLDFMNNNCIEAKIQKPQIFRNKTENVCLSIDELQNFINQHLAYERTPQNMKQYSVAQYDLLKLLSDKRKRQKI